jgi:hypothetical protein
MDLGGSDSYGVRVLGTRRSVMVAAALFLLPACSATAETGALPPDPSGRSATPTSPTAPATPATPTAGSTAEVDRTDVLAVYTAWWAVLETAYAKGDPDAPALAEYAVDPILGRQRASIRSLKAQGVVQRTTFTLKPRLRYQTEQNAEVEDCVTGPANTYYDAITGRPRAPRGYRNDVPTEDRLTTTLQKRGDQWYVVAATGRGEVAC